MHCIMIACMSIDYFTNVVSTFTIAFRLIVSLKGKVVKINRKDITTVLYIHRVHLARGIGD